MLRSNAGCIVSPKDIEDWPLEDLETTTAKIVHMHVPKTAGTALRSAFEKHGKGKLRIFPHYDERKYGNVDPNEFDFFSGHIGFKTAKRLGGDIITLLRNPVDRFASVYYFWRTLHEKGVEDTVNTRLAAKYPIEEFALIREIPSLIEEFYNRMTWQVAYGSMAEHRRELRESGQTDEKIYRMALENIQEFAVVGVQEDIPGFSERIKQRYGIDLNIERINVTPTRSETFDLTFSAIRRIQEWVPMDIELFEFARRLV